MLKHWPAGSWKNCTLAYSLCTMCCCCWHVLTDCIVCHELWEPWKSPLSLPLCADIRHKLIYSHGCRCKCTHGHTHTHTHTAFYWEWKHKVFLMLQGFRKWTSALYICSHTTSVIRPGWGLGDSISSLMPLLSFFCLLMTNPAHYTSWSFTKRWLHLHLKLTSWYLPLKAHV